METESHGPCQGSYWRQREFSISEEYRRTPKDPSSYWVLPPQDEGDVLVNELQSLSEAFYAKGVFSSWTVIHSDDFAKGVNYGNQALRGAFFRPNIVFPEPTAAR